MTELSAYGGKGLQLLKLKQYCKSFTVPNFFIVSWNDSLEQLPKQISQLQGNYFAVRSSANVEDAATNSFAGLFTSKLFISKQEIAQAIEDVRQSVQTEQVQVYCKQKNIDMNTIKMNVVVQEMVNADCAGVVFSKPPQFPEINEVVISSVYGIGKGLVDGELNADVFKGISNHWKHTLAKKEQQYNFVHQQLKKVNVEHTLQELPSLTEQQCNELEQVALELEQLFGVPQDIEFAYNKQQLYILQSRAMTNLPTEPLKIWDNSNIVESYPEITLPFTFSFILKLYETVYQNIGLLLGVRQQQIDANQDVFESMLGHIKGRVYYDLENWYKALSMLPAYKLNAGFMETMMGVSEPLRVTITTKQPLSKLQAIVQLAQSVVKIIQINRKLPLQKQEFTAMIRSTIAQYNSTDFTALTEQEIWQQYKTFRGILVNQWNPPLANDLFAMFYFGSLEKFCAKHFQQPHLHSELIIGKQEVLSTQPAILLEKIIATAQQEQRFQHFKEKSFDWIHTQIQHNQFGQTGRLIQAYLNEFGDRFVGELKLENDTFRQQPKLFYQIIASYQETAITSYQTKQKTIDIQALTKQLPRGKRWWFNYLIRKASETVADRENLRLERTKVFGMVRVFLLEIAQKLLQKGVLTHPKDIFYLKEDEVEQYLLGKHSFEIGALIQERKKEYSTYKKEYAELPHRIFQRGNLTDDALEITPNKIESELVGLPCYPGLVTNKVIVLNSPNEVESLNGCILVTKSTDPGWITIFKSASAIVVERGSPLSHTAIVCREMGIPCVVAVKGITQVLQTGDTIQVNGTTGKITTIETQHSLF